MPSRAANINSVVIGAAMCIPQYQYGLFTVPTVRYLWNKLLNLKYEGTIFHITQEGSYGSTTSWKVIPFYLMSNRLLPSHCSSIIKHALV